VGIGEGQGAECGGRLVRWAGLFAPSGSSVAEPHLHPGLGQSGPLRQLLPGVDVGVLGPLEGPLQRLQLLGGEGGAAAARFAFQLDARLALGVGIRTCKGTT